MSILAFLTVPCLFGWVTAVSPGHPVTVPGFLVEITIRFLIYFLETSMQEQVQGADYVASKSIFGAGGAAPRRGAPAGGPELDDLKTI